MLTIIEILFIIYCPFHGFIFHVLYCILYLLIYILFGSVTILEKKRIWKYRKENESVSWDLIFGCHYYKYLDATIQKLDFIHLFISYIFKDSIFILYISYFLFLFLFISTFSYFYSCFSSYFLFLYLDKD